MTPAGRSETAFRCGSLYPKCFFRALAEILSKRALLVWMISYSSSRARSSFAPDETALAPGRPRLSKAVITPSKAPVGPRGGQMAGEAQLLASFFVRAPCRFILYSACAEIVESPLQAGARSSIDCPRAGRAPRPVDGRNLRFAAAVSVKWGRPGHL